MTQEELDAIRARADAATPGPWRWGNWYTTYGERETFDEAGDRLTLEHAPMYGPEPAVRLRTHYEQTIDVLPSLDDMLIAEHHRANAQFIAHARADLPVLLDHIAQLRDIVDWVARFYLPTWLQDERMYVCEPCNTRSRDMTDFPHQPFCVVTRARELLR